MPERPLLILPSSGEPVQRRKRSGGGGSFHRPKPARQVERLTPQFKRLQESFEAKSVRLQAEASHLVPEEVVVLEVIGTVENFIRAVERIPGMEWLVELEEEEIPADDDFFVLDKKGNRRFDKETLKGRLFMVFSNNEALSQMLSLWSDWQSNKPFARGLGRWRSLFQQLRNVRRWGVEDRLLDTGILEDWQDRVEYGEEEVPCEIELWYRKSAIDRKKAHTRVTALVEELGGRVEDESEIEEIAYHTLLAYLPIDRVRQLIQMSHKDVSLVQCEHIQFMRASGQMSSTLPEDYSEHDLQHTPEPEMETAGLPVIALLDGLPLQAHRRLLGRLIVDDPENLELSYPAESRRHGTAMASLILYGDLSSKDPVLPKPIYVRPILQPDPRSRQSGAEAVPEGVLVVDVIHRAVRRLFEGEGDEAPIAPQVSIINLSIGISDRPFEQFMSPLARLLDWLAWRYKVLFVVSSGNCNQRIEFPSGEPICEEQIIASIAADARNRRLLSPAEAINALTVAAIHEDASSQLPVPGWVDPYTTSGLPSPINTQGMGYRRSIKPDLLAPGGRVAVQQGLKISGQPDGLEVYKRLGAPGQLVASPGSTPGNQDASWYTRGTSNATAIVSRSCCWLNELLDDLRGEPSGEEVIDSIPRSIWLKTMVAHGAEWGLAGTTLTSVLKNEHNSRQFREYITRLLGYGAINIERVRECTPHRVTTLSAGTLAKDESHIHRLPLPPSLNGVRGYRRLSLTLGWVSPVNTRHQGWRRADLWFSPPSAPLQVARSQADWRAVQRGTLQHEILEGEDAGVFVDGESMNIQVSCRSSAGVLDDDVAYALVTTLEIAEELEVDIYDEIQLRVHAARVRADAAD